MLSLKLRLLHFREAELFRALPEPFVGIIQFIGFPGVDDGGVFVMIDAFVAAGVIFVIVAVNKEAGRVAVHQFKEFFEAAVRQVLAVVEAAGRCM